MNGENTGILLLAMGHPNYLQMACNLAMSIRCAAPNVKICVAWHGTNPKTLPPDKLKLFTDFVEVPQKMLLKKKQVRYFRVKTQLNKLTPYDSTLFLDVDLLWSSQHNITQLFIEFKDLEYTASNWGGDVLEEGKPAMHPDVWADTLHIAKAYKLWGKKYIPLHSELIWFKKCEAVDRLFALALEIFDKPKVPVFKYADDVPDEFAFNVATAVLEMYPHKTPWLPIWWHNRKADRNVPGPEIFKRGYLGISVAGNNTNEMVRNRYNQLMRYNAQKNGVQNPWKIQPKKRWLPERKAV